MPDKDGVERNYLVISYVNKDSGISYLKYEIPESERFEWQYTYRSQADAPFQAFDIETRQPIFNDDGTPKMVQWKSYDNKWVKRKPIQDSRELSEGRINEILCSWGSRVNMLFEAHTPTTWFCDIETDVGPEGFPEPESAAMAINTIAITKFPQTIVFGRKPLSENEQIKIQENLRNYSSLTKDYIFEYRYFQTEREMIESFLDFIQDIPAITGWNFLGYDWKYIYNRCNNLGININRICPTGKFTKFKLNRKNVIECMVPVHKIIYDYMIVYRQWDRTVEVKENDSLNFVSEKVLGITKVEHEWGFEEFYRDHYMEYVFYNAVDTILVEKIDATIHTAQIWYMLASELRIDLNAAYSTIQPAETVMTNFVFPNYKVVPRKIQNSQEDDGDYAGAFVWPTQAGLFKYIGGLDFASLYPSIMRQFGISPEAFMFKDITYQPKADEIKTVSGAVYKKMKDAVIPAILTEFFAKRKQAKSERKTCDTEAEQLIKIYEKRFGKFKHTA
ncbi:MAG: DNA polymerase [Wendovervirus sonii]|uniref:DNA-directed DNA polymerase n=1 Tax=phage Lak_Megaphage_Sonny TaxID=3109229 RepID=A0ABZ0Z434_9CAUD|nr:MAG: DNA polymerase [phage Lak_Megaphage_Sonny]